MSAFDKICPVFFIDENIKESIINIELKLSSLKINNKSRRDYMIRKANIRSIHSSLSIEANSLSLNDVINISSNKEVKGDKEDIIECKNSLELYKNINTFDYKKEEDLIKAYQILMRNLNAEISYRNHGEGVIRNGKLIYQAPNSFYVPSLMKSLFEYINTSDIHPLILGCLFHYYFVYIHPFSDGNGRLSRFWLSLILNKYDSNFEYIPIEEEIKNSQEEYYQAIDESHINGNANIFIKYILKVINKSLDNICINNDIITNYIDNGIIDLIMNDSSITQDKIADILDINVRTVKRHFKALINNRIITRVGSDKTGNWEVM